MKIPKLSYVQQWAVIYLQNHNNAVVRATYSNKHNYWYYGMGALIKGYLNNWWWGIQYSPCILDTDYKDLIHKGILVAEMEEKEFTIQKALGTVEYRLYKLAEEYK